MRVTKTVVIDFRGTMAEWEEWIVSESMFLGKPTENDAINGVPRCAWEANGVRTSAFYSGLE